MIYQHHQLPTAQQRFGAPGIITAPRLLPSIHVHSTTISVAVVVSACVVHLLGSGLVQRHVQVLLLLSAACGSLRWQGMWATEAQGK